ncbi:DUF4458 domain-containing protein [uncultured Bacteroides sp.]|uniref:DUF4458 domain-containing protein n=1 Tax=uncultured Bacteroides sp. TaxID=162156 RepID=UPI0026754DDE|nr:DUF4458 domain-containing protein [uncultured Bacteroides sp.]
MKLTFFLARFLCISLLLGTSVWMAGCSDDDELVQSAGNGYIQFKLYKEASYEKQASSRSSSDQLDFLNDAKKVKVVLKKNEMVSSYTLSLHAYDEESAEYGLRSDKLELVSGEYTLIGYYLYNKVEESIYAGEPSVPTNFTITEGGLNVQDLVINTIARGKVKFRLTKDLSAIQTRAEGETQYPLTSIALVDVTVKNLATKISTSLQNMEVEYEEDFNDEGKETSYVVIDSLITLEAGEYQVVSCFTKQTKTKTLEVGTPQNIKFSIVDNKEMDVDIPVTLHESADYIKDYLALKAIWEQMEGEEWSYVGESYARGVNWNFDKDVDLWGDQPGVSLNSEGRVISMSIGDFGPKGMVPEQIGELTALESLALGTHNDLMRPQHDELSAAMKNLTEENLKIIRNDYMDNVVKHDLRSDFSEPLRWGMKEKGVSIAPKSRGGISLFDVNWGDYTNGITGIHPAIGKLKKLEVLYIANAPITDLPDETSEGADIASGAIGMAGLTACTDLEIYNCPKLERFPDVLGKMPELIQVNLAMNKQWKSDDINAGLEKWFGTENAKKLQILYLGYNNISQLPASVSNLEKLSKIDCVYNKLTSLPSFTEKVNLVQAAFDYNEISTLPETTFCGMADVETLSFSHNKITEFPDFFDVNSIYTMKSVDFSNNQITEIPDDYQGINVSTLSLANNRLTRFPKGLFASGSPITELNLSGNLIATFEKGDLTGKNTYMLTTLDLTYNRLKELPDDFNGKTLPYLYGLDVSWNRFSAFPYGALNISYLTVLGIRGQRDEDGNRIYKEWPASVSEHKGLRALYLGSNDIGKVADTETISYLIYNLDISDNPEIVINLSAVCPYIEAGMYNLIYDSTQDIRGCDALDLE